jgi:polysaccharide biosynthesis PFTS motif protein
LSDSGEAAPRPSRDYIAVFDVSPYREAFRAITGLHMGYYTMPIVEKFLTDLISEAERLGFDVLLKPKNVESRNIDIRYRQLLNTLDRHRHVSIADERIAASRLADEASAIISLPFATTAQLGGYLGIPSCYYDPTGKLRRFRSLSHGMDMLFGPDELAHWMAQKLGSPMGTEQAVRIAR